MKLLKLTANFSIYREDREDATEEQRDSLETQAMDAIVELVENHHMLAGGGVTVVFENDP